MMLESKLNILYNLSPPNTKGRNYDIIPYNTHNGKGATNCARLNKE